jgi:cobalt-precorrin 5A hydrolase
MERDKMIVAGFGFRKTATVSSLMDAFAIAGVKNVDAIATAEDKSQAVVFQTFAKTLGAPIIAVGPLALSNADTTTHSLTSQTHRATGSVAEAAALAAIGEDAKLQTTRSISNDRMATCAIAQGPKI